MLSNLEITEEFAFKECFQHSVLKYLCLLCQGDLLLYYGFVARHGADNIKKKKETVTP